jgi:hypothetical protein
LCWETEQIVVGAAGPHVRYLAGLAGVQERGGDGDLGNWVPSSSNVPP